MYNKQHGCAENGDKEYLASNQVVGGSNLSRRAEFINDLAHFRKLELPHNSPSCLPYRRHSNVNCYRQFIDDLANLIVI